LVFFLATAPSISILVFGLWDYSEMKFFLKSKLTNHPTAAAVVAVAAAE
jgi:hypothetical protein